MQSLNMYNILLIGLPLLFSVLSSSVILPRDLGVILLLISFGPLMVYAFASQSLSITSSKSIFYAFTALTIILCINTFFGKFGEIQDLIFPLVTVYIFILSVFVVPPVIKDVEFLYTVNRISAVFVLIGIPIILFGDMNILWFTLENWRSPRVIPILNWEHYPIRSVFDGSQNQASRLFFVGFLAGLFESIRRSSLAEILFTSINATGLILTHSRGAIGVALIGTVLIIAYLLYGNRGVVVSALIGFLGPTAVFFAQFGIAPENLNLVDMSNRLAIWQGGVDAVRAQPLLGYGVGDTAEMMRPFAEGNAIGKTAHNGYLRMFLYTGVVGGIAYIYLITKPIANTVLRPSVEYNIGILAIAVSFMIHHFVGGTPLFGANFYAVAMGISIGYLIKYQHSNSDCLLTSSPI